MKLNGPSWYLARHGTPKEKFYHAYWHCRTGKGWTHLVDPITREALGRLMKDWLATSAWKTNAADEKYAQELAQDIDKYTGVTKMLILSRAFGESRERFRRRGDVEWGGISHNHS